MFPYSIETGVLMDLVVSVVSAAPSGDGLVSEEVREPSNPLPATNDTSSVTAHAIHGKTGETQKAFVAKRNAAIHARVRVKPVSTGSATLCQWCSVPRYRASHTV